MIDDESVSRILDEIERISGEMKRALEEHLQVTDQISTTGCDPAVLEKSTYLQAQIARLDSKRDRQLERLRSALSA